MNGNQAKSLQKVTNLYKVTIYAVKQVWDSCFYTELPKYYIRVNNLQI